jgi:di/tricarboxylate transporter
MMVGASCAFITPTGYQTNMMVWGPGGYTFMDFVKIGLPLTVCVGVVAILMAPVVFPF